MTHCGKIGRRKLENYRKLGRMSKLVQMFSILPIKHEENAHKMELIVKCGAGEIVQETSECLGLEKIQFSHQVFDTFFSSSLLTFDTAGDIFKMSEEVFVAISPSTSAHLEEKS